MTVGAALVMFAVIWFMCLFVVLPIRLKSQSETGKIIEGTPASAPADPNLRTRLKWTTLIAIPIWIVICAMIITGVISVDMLDFYNGIE